MGSIAEDSVLPLLSSEDDLVRDRACQILGFIGTAKSLPKLEEIAATEQINAGHATTAVRKIKSRP
jgi:HEAT repeat protein